MNGAHAATQVDDTTSISLEADVAAGVRQNGVARSASSPDWASMTSAIRTGDAVAFSQFYRERFDPLVGLVRHLARLDESSCLDIVQEVFLRVIRGMPVLDTEEQISRWLARVARSCACDYLRAMERRRRREARFAAMVAPPSLDDSITERRAWLEQEIQRLGDEPRWLMTRRYLWGWTLRRIGEHMNLKTGAVDSRIGRIVAKLRRRARERFDE